jgi:EpsI family protein
MAARAIYLCAALIALSAAAYHGLRLSGTAGHGMEPTKPARPLAQLPRELNGWVGEDVELAPDIVRVAGADDYLRRDYKDRDGNTVSLYIAFYGSVTDHVPHGPTVCYPSQGWHTAHDEMIAIPTTASDFESLQTRKLCYERDGARVAVLYWYAANGKQQVDPTLQKFHAALRDLIGHGGAYVFQVMLTAPVGDSAERPYASLERFLGDAFGAIAAHLPSNGRHEGAGGGS